MPPFQIIAAVVALAAAAGYVNYRWLHLPTTIGMMLLMLVLSGVLLVLRAGGWIEVEGLVALVKSVRFGDLVLHGLLGLLLFAGALHVDVAGLKDEAWPVGVLATLGVAIATATTGALLWLVAASLGIGIALLPAFVFGALIAPTDPIAVLAVLRQVGVPKRLELQITGESLFNDGVAVVVFMTLIRAAFGETPAPLEIAAHLAREVLGALVLGGALGYGAVRMLATVDDYPVEVLITLAVAMGGYSLAEALGVSAPITAAVSGLLVGSRGRARSMSEQTRRRLDEFWEMGDYIMNAVLFVLMGLEVLTIHVDLVSGVHAWLLAATVAIVLAARLVSVSLPIALLRSARWFGPGTVRMLTWGGLRGGVSISLALSLPQFPQRDLFLAMTYAVVVFSMVVQGLTLKPLALRIARAQERDTGERKKAA